MSAIVLRTIGQTSSRNSVPHWDDCLRPIAGRGRMAAAASVQSVRTRPEAASDSCEQFLSTLGSHRCGNGKATGSGLDSSFGMQMAERPQDRNASHRSLGSASPTGIPNCGFAGGMQFEKPVCRKTLLSRAFSQELLIRKYIELIRELGRFPIEGDLAHKHMADKLFPDRNAFSRLGRKRTRCLAYWSTVGQMKATRTLYRCADASSRQIPRSLTS